MIDIMLAIQEKLIAARTAAGNRVYPLTLPEDAHIPAITFQRIPGRGRTMAHDGPTGYVSTRAQIDAWAQDYETAHAIAKQVRLELDGFRGTIGSADPVTVAEIKFDDDRDDYNPEIPLYRVIMSAAVDHQEDV